MEEVKQSSHQAPFNIDLVAPLVYVAQFLKGPF